MDLKKIFWVLTSIMLTILSAILLNFTSQKYSLLSIAGIILIGCVIFVNFVKFILWGKIYNKYDLSEVYPLTALFFPIIYIISLYQNETSLSFRKLIGVLIILVGCFIFNQKR